MVVAKLWWLCFCLKVGRCDLGGASTSLLEPSLSQVSPPGPLSCQEHQYILLLDFSSNPQQCQLETARSSRSNGVATLYQSVSWPGSLVCSGPVSLQLGGDYHCRVSERKGHFL